MSLQDQGASSPSTDLSARRKRDCQRREENYSQEEDAIESPRSDRTKRNKESGSVANVASGHDMLGCAITGVIEGSFDAGYFLNVRSVDTGTHLRGIVFIPGRFTPITAANDLAPSVKMYQREEMLIPSSVLSPQIKANVGDQSSMEKCTEKMIEAKEGIVMEDEVNKKDLDSVTELTNGPVGTVDEQLSLSGTPLQSKKTGNVESNSQVEFKESVVSEDEAITLPSKESIDVAGITIVPVGTLQSKKNSSDIIESHVENQRTDHMEPEPEHQQTLNNVSELEEVHVTKEKDESPLAQGACEDMRLEASTRTMLEDEKSRRDGRNGETGSCSSVVVLVAETNVPTPSDCKLVLEEPIVPNAEKVKLEAHGSTTDITINVIREDTKSAD